MILDEERTYNVMCWGATEGLPLQNRIVNSKVSTVKESEGFERTAVDNDASLMVSMIGRQRHHINVSLIRSTWDNTAGAKHLAGVARQGTHRERTLNTIGIGPGYGYTSSI